MNTIFDEAIASGSAGMPDALSSMQGFLWPAGVSIQPSLRPHPTGEAEVAEWLENRVREDMENYEPQHRLEPCPGDRCQKWWAMSGMQKAIRRNETLLAYKSGRALLVGGQQSLVWRRLATVATEDVALGAPFAATAVSFLARNKAVRDELGPEKCLYWAIDRLCEAPKDRNNNDAIVHMLVSPKTKEWAQALQGSTMDSLVQTAASLSAPFGLRLLAHWMMFGHRFPIEGVQMPTETKALTEFMLQQFWDEIKLPPLLRLLYELNIPATNEPLALSTPFIWQMICASPDVQAETDWWDVGENEMIGNNLLASAFDKHTREGKSANAYFLKACPAAAEFAAKHCKTSAFDAMGEPVFTVEGGLLRKRLMYVGAKRVFDATFEAYMETDGWVDADAAREFCQIVQKNLPTLNHARKRILGLT